MPVHYPVTCRRSHCRVARRCNTPAYPLRWSAQPVPMALLLPGTSVPCHPPSSSVTASFLWITHHCFTAPPSPMLHRPQVMHLVALVVVVHPPSQPQSL